MKRIFAVMVFLLLKVCTAFSQEEEKNNKEEEPFKPGHEFGLTIGHEHVFNGVNAEGKKEVLALPFWGLDYNYRISPKFALALHTDFILESFEVEKHLDGEDETIVERTRPFAPAVMGFYKPAKHWNFGLGMGGEFSKEENYVLTRAAVEYGVEIRHGWELAGSIQYDFRWKAYDTWTVGLGILKALGKK